MLAGQRLLLAARRLPAHGLEAWAEVQRRGYEGLVAKDEASAYLGGRTRSWLKVKRRNGDGARSANGAQAATSVQFSVEPRHCMLLGEQSAPREIVEDDDLHGAAEAAEAFLVQLARAAGARREGQEADALAAVADM